jgi:selenocysteine-specific elongation factor
MTIELGFGWMTLPNGEEVGIVDVPGHRDFIENMLSGIAGIDAVLLVIAADEGVMPQTKEHLAILDLLQIPAGLIVLTKTDLASDPTWLDLVSTDIRAAVSDTVLRDAPILRVSAKNKTGLESLVSSLQSLLATKPTRPNLSRPRLPIDRVFTMSGFGAVVTGTLSDGSFTVGDEVEILPSGLKGRIRGLQTHKRKEDVANAGSRTAMNISGIDSESIRRGDVVVHVNQYQPTRRLDARVRLLKDASASLKHNDEVKFFVGASETIGTMRLLDVEELTPNHEAWIQLELREPVVAVRGDRYILRRPSPGETLGGGAIVDHQPKGRHKRFDDGVLKSLESLAQGSPSDVLLEATIAVGVAPIKDVVTRSRLEVSSAEAALAELLLSTSIVLLEEGAPTSSSDLLIASQPNWQTLRDRAMQIVNEFHANFPLRRGVPREELKSKLKLSARVFNAIINKLIADCSLTDRSACIALSGHEIEFDGVDQAKVQKMMRAFEQNPFSLPSVKECKAEVGEEVFNALIELGKLKTVSEDVVFRKSDYDSVKLQIQKTIEDRGQITLAEVRDLFGTSRKYAQALLEHFDATGFTIRDGDFRKLRR